MRQRRGRSVEDYGEYPLWRIYGVSQNLRVSWPIEFSTEIENGAQAPGGVMLERIAWALGGTLRIEIPA
jgi:hypothetical protein